MTAKEKKLIKFLETSKQLEIHETVLSKEDVITCLKLIKQAEISDECIIHVKDNWLAINMDSKDLGKAIKTCIDYLTKRSNNYDR